MIQIRQNAKAVGTRLSPAGKPQPNKDDFDTLDWPTLIISFGPPLGGTDYSVAGKSRSGGGGGLEGLPDTLVADIVVDPTYANTLYAATDICVFYTTKGGTAWTALGGAKYRNRR